MNEAIEKLWRRMQLVVGLGRIKTGNDTGAAQLQQVQIGQSEIKDDTPRLGEYGFASMPLPGCHAVIVFVGGDRSNGVIVATNDQQHRLKNLTPGESALYTDLGQMIYLKRTGTIIDGGGLPVEFLNTPSITHNGVEIGSGHVHGGVVRGGALTDPPAS